MPGRRRFLKSLAFTLPAMTGLLGGDRSPQARRVTQGRAASGRVLVVLELAGGVDGLNVVVPFRNDIYYQKRPRLALREANGILPLDEAHAFHPSMSGFLRLWDQGLLAVVQGVGYPGMARSHFVSRRVWHSADPRFPFRSGWIGRYLALDSDREGVRAMSLGSPVPPALDVDPSAGVLRQGVVEVTDSGASAARELAEVSSILAKRPGIEVCYVTVSGFDTHLDQAVDGAPAEGRLAHLLDGVAVVVLEFWKGLRKRGISNQVLLLVFSEFGRSLRENAGLGTDHGTAGPVFLIGEGVRGGCYGRPPALEPERLDPVGEVVPGVDFRSLYAEVLREWLAADQLEVLGQDWSDPALKGIISPRS